MYRWYVQRYLLARIVVRPVYGIRGYIYDPGNEAGLVQSWGVSLPSLIPGVRNVIYSQLQG